MRILSAILPTSRQRVCSERSHHFIPLLVYPNDTMPAVINLLNKLRNNLVNKLINDSLVRRTVLSIRECSQHIYSHHVEVNHGNILGLRLELERRCLWEIQEFL